MEKLFNTKTSSAALVVIGIAMILQIILPYVSKSNNVNAGDVKEQVVEVKTIAGKTLTLLTTHSQTGETSLQTIKKIVDKLDDISKTLERVSIIQERILHEAEKMENFRIKSP